MMNLFKLSWLPDPSVPAQRNALAYSATTLATVMMNSIFQFYYVKVYLDTYGLSSWWFKLAQVIFLVWNAVNDPLFGWLQDTSKASWLSDRRKNILYGAPLFIISFLVPWFPQYLAKVSMWVMGLHLIFVLCFYDTMFTFVVLAQCSLFTELSPKQEDRQLLIKYNQIASLIGSSSIYFAETASVHATNIPRLSLFCLLVACISYFFLVVSATNMKPSVNRQADSLAGRLQPSSSSLEKAVESERDESFGTWLAQVKQILRQPNFLLFVAMNFCQVFHNTFRSNFFVSFADQLIGLRFGHEFLNAISGAAYVLPQLLVLLLGPLLAKWGSYQLIAISFVFKVSSSLLMLVIGRSAIIPLSIFFILDRSVSEATFSIFNLCLSDVIDADAALHSRSKPCSSTVFGLNALFTKPAQSLAPIFIVQVMDSYGYSSGVPVATESGAGQDALKSGIFLLLCGVPACLGIVQTLLWRFYTLRASGKEEALIVG